MIGLDGMLTVVLAVFGACVVVWGAAVLWGTWPDSTQGNRRSGFFGYALVMLGAIAVYTAGLMAGRLL